MRKVHPYYFGLHGFEYGNIYRGNVNTKSFYASNGSQRNSNNVYGELTNGHHRKQSVKSGRIYCACAPGVYSYDWTTKVAPSYTHWGEKYNHYDYSPEYFRGRGQRTTGAFSGGYCDLSLNESENGKCSSMVYIGGIDRYQHSTPSDKRGWGNRYSSLSQAHNRFYDAGGTISEAKDDGDISVKDLIGDILFYNFEYIDNGDITIKDRFSDGVTSFKDDPYFKKFMIEWAMNPSSMSKINTYSKAIPQTCGCCPNLLSDSRLKDVGEAYTSGLSELKKLKIYNYVFKNDSLRVAHVGVIAQDLKRIFPNAVYKDENGYYKIRWDEMFYAAINAVKELNTRIDSLASRVHNDIERVETLKRDNAELAKKLDKLSAELAALEKVKK